MTYRIYIALLLLCCISCRKDIAPPIPNTGDATFRQIFADYWNKMNVNYLYWDIDTTNWDGVYSRYKPAFDTLDIGNQNDQLTAVRYLAQLTGGLVDCHYSITFGSKPASNYVVFPAYARKLKAPGYHKAYGYLHVDSNYFDVGSIVSGSYYSQSNKSSYTALCATISNKILYFNCSGFVLDEAYRASSANGIQTVLKHLFGILQAPPVGIKGIIIDVRNNHGGNVPDLNLLIGRLIDKPLHIGYTRYKTGNNRLDYTPWIDANVMPVTGSKAIQMPVIALADNFSISLAEAVTIAIHTLPTGKFVGETTWGATGPIADNGLYNAGQFNVGNFMSIYTSSAEFRYNDNQSYENKGFTPDVPVAFDINALNSGKDPMLEKAISLIP